MRLRLRQFDLRTNTAGGLFGVSLPFSPGLVVLRADNSSGKSTCLQGIVYALGLEGMLSASRAIPLPHVATASLTDETGRELAVLESYVTLEFENEAGQIATVRRYAKHGSIDTQLITVWDGPALTAPSAGFRESAYFVRRRGAAQREAGFHHWFTNFMGWELPEVPRFDGGASPLYLETIFPLFYVEQKRGWAGIQPQMPTYLRIRDVGRQAVTFVLALSTGDLAAQRQLLQERKADVRQQWIAAVAAFRSGANEHGIVVRGVPGEPVAEWPIEPRPSLWIAAPEAPEEWQSLGNEIDRLNGELAQLDKRLLPRAEDAAPVVSAELQASLQELHDVSSLADALQRELAIEVDQVHSLDSRITSLQDDMRRSQDAEVLQRMGAPISAVTPEDCPTCHQELPATLLDPAAAIVPMPIERNIQLLKEQIDLFQAMLSDLDSAIAAKRQQTVTFNERIHGLQQAVRAQRETLVSASGAPSIRDIEQRVHLRDRAEALSLVVGRLSSLNTELERLAQEWAGVLAEEARLRSQTTPDSDRRKIAALQSRFLAQLREYDFTSLPISDLTISEDTFQPVYEGFDLGFEMSASDMVRSIWAHRMALLEVGREFATRHAQLLIFDEPRQQSADPLSFATLFKRAAQSERWGQQVIFATSEPEGNIRTMLSSVSHQYLGFSGKMIRQLDH